MSSSPSATSHRAVGTGSKPTDAPPARFRSGAASDSDESDGDGPFAADGSPGRAPTTRRSLAATLSSPTKEPTAEELDAIVAKLRDEARAEAGASDATGAAAPSKRRTYGRAGGLLRKIALPSASPDATGAVPQKLFGSSSLTSLDPSSEAASGPLAGGSSQKTATGSDADDPDRTLASSGRPSAVSRPQLLRPGSPSRRLVSSDANSSEEDAAETYNFAARRPRKSAGGQPMRVISSSSIVVSSPPVATHAPRASASSLKRPVEPVSGSAPISVLPPPSVDKALLNSARPFRPPPSARAPLGLGPEDSTVSFGSGRSLSPAIGEFAPGEGTQGSAAVKGVHDENERLRGIRITPPPSSPASTISPTVEYAPSSFPVEGSSTSSARTAHARSGSKTVGGRRVLVDSDDEDGVVAVARDEMADLFGDETGNAGADGDEAWIGDVVRAVKEKRRGAAASSPPLERSIGGAKGLSKKELEKMKLEQARMQRERKTVIDKPEQETRDMLTFLRRKREAAAARKTQTNPLDTQRFFRDSPRLASSSGGLFSTPLPPGRPSSDRTSTPALTFGATAAPEGESAAESSDPIVSSNPGLAQPLIPASRRTSDRHHISLDGSDSDGDAMFDDIDVLFAKKKRAEVARMAEEQIARERRERLQIVKERAAALALTVSNGKAIKLAGDSDSDSDLEIAPTTVADVKPTTCPTNGTRAATANREVVAKTERNSLVHRNLAKYGVVHKASRVSVGGASPAGSSAKRATPAQATESQILAAGLTFGHGSSSPAGPGASKRAGIKAHHARPVTKDDLAASLLAKAQAQRRREIAEKDAKHGRAPGPDARWTQKEETDYDSLMQGAQVRKSDWILITEADPDASGEEDDDAEDSDFDPDAVDVDDEAAEAAVGSVDGELEEGVSAGEVDEMVADDEVTAAAVAGGARSPTADSQHSDKENSLPAGALPPDDGGKESRQSSGVLEERPLAAEEDDDDEKSFPIPHRTKRRRTVLLDEDEDEDGTTSPRPASVERMGSPISRARLAASAGKRASFGVLPSPSASPRPSQTATVLGSTASLGPAFVATATDDAFDASGQGDDGFGGSGGFSQFFEPTQAGTVATERSAESQGGMDLDGEGGFSQFFSQTQVTTPPKGADVAKEDGLKQLRALANDAPLRPEMSQLPSLDVSATQQEAVANALARDAIHEHEAEEEESELPRTGKRMFINQDGFFTQNEPSTFVMDETPDRPTLGNSLTTPATPSVHQGLPAALAASSSSPVKLGRKLVRRQDRVQSEEDDDDDDDDVVADSQPPAASPLQLAPIFRRPEKKERDPNRPRKPRVMTDEMRALMEDQAVESDEDDGFGQFGQTRASDDEAEDDEDQDKPVEGLVNDEEMTADAEKQADEERARLARELAEAEDERQMKIAQDVTTGEFRKKKKDALSMEMESDEEDQYGTSKRSREERRRKRKLDKLDPMERLEVDPETAPFAKMYADTYNDDAEEYGNLLSEDDEAAVPDSEANNFAESLGLPKTRQHRRRIVASPEPLLRTGSSASLRIYADGSDDDDEDNLTESQVQIRRGSSKHRPQAHPIQQDDDAYSLGVSTGYSNSDTSQRQQSQDRRQRLESFARDESQNLSAAKAGSTSSVTGLKRKASASSDGTGSAIKRRVTALVDAAGKATTSLLGPRLSKKWEK